MANRESGITLREGARVLIRSPRAADRREYCAIRRDSHDFLIPWEPVPARPVTEEERFDQLLHSNRSEDLERVFVCARDDGRILGNINISNIVRGCFQSAVLGYWCRQDAAGQGFMSEGLRLVAEFAFEDLGLHRLEANIQPSNAPSIALVRRVGFQQEGYSPRYLKIAGEWRDHERWTLLAEDWRTAAETRPQP